jgi:flagellar basal body P-ring formation protein FlgA
VIETTDAVVPTHGIGRGDLIKAADLVFERHPKAEVGIDAIGSTAEAIGRVARQPLRPGQPVRHADIAKPELIKRDDNVTVVYEVPGIVLTTRGKALEGGGEGDVISVLNLQSKRNVQGIVTAPGRVDIATVAPRPIDPLEPAASE